MIDAFVICRERIPPMRGLYSAEGRASLGADRCMPPASSRFFQCTWLPDGFSRCASRRPDCGRWRRRCTMLSVIIGNFVTSPDEKPRRLHDAEAVPAAYPHRTPRPQGARPRHSAGRARHRGRGDRVGISRCTKAWATTAALGQARPTGLSRLVLGFIMVEKPPWHSPRSCAQPSCQDAA